MDRIDELIIELRGIRKELNTISCELVRVQEAILDAATPVSHKVQVKTEIKPLPVIIEAAMNNFSKQVAETLEEPKLNEKINWGDNESNTQSDQANK